MVEVPENLKKLGEFAAKASDIVDKYKLEDTSPVERMIMFRDPDRPKEALGVVFHEEIEALAKKMKIEFTIISRSDITTMRISKLTLHELEQIKEHPREPVESVVQRMIAFWHGHSDCEELNEPMADSLKNTLKDALENKFGVKCTKITDEDEGTVFHFKGNPKGTPVIIPKR